MRKVYYNADVVTMDDSMPQAQAVVIEDKKIVYVGSNEEALQKAEDAERIDLAGRALLPGFIDPHSHFSGVAFAFLQVPLGETACFEDIQIKITDHIRNNHVPAGTWISCKGYDHNSLKEKAHPTAQWLDSFVPDYPVVLQHKSGHMGVFNSMALKELGITPDTPCPNGGKIGLTEDGLCNGYMEETIYIDTVTSTPMPSPQEIFGGFLRAQQKYASYGITTAHEGMFVKELAPMYQALIANHMLQIDVVGYADFKAKDMLLEQFADCVGIYKDHFRLGGIKMILDGSPQGRTAWMETPYVGTPDYYGYPVLQDETVLETLQFAAAHGLQALAHCNGDAAAEQYIRCNEQAQAADPTSANNRNVMVHAQLCRPDQMLRVAALQLIPTFFAAHVFHWGDVHIENFGKERAEKISCVRSAIDAGVNCYTFHQDSPIIEPDMLETLWVVTNRQTKKGVSLGKDQCLSTYDALKGITIHAAFQYFEEKHKGSVTAGKDADLIILDRNPLKVDPADLRSVIVLETIKAGNTIYQKA